MNARRNFIKGALSTLTFGLFEQRIMAEVRVSSPVDVQPKTVYGLRNNINIASGYTTSCSEYESLIVAISENKEWLGKAAIQFTLDYLIEHQQVIAVWMQSRGINLTKPQLISALTRCGIKVDQPEQEPVWGDGGFRTPNEFCGKYIGNIKTDEEPNFATAKMFCESIGRTFYDIVEVDIDLMHLVKKDVLLVDKDPEKERLRCLGQQMFYKGNILVESRGRRTAL